MRKGAHSDANSIDIALDIVQPTSRVWKEVKKRKGKKGKVDDFYNYTVVRKSF